MLAHKARFFFSLNCDESACIMCAWFASHLEEVTMVFSVLLVLYISKDRELDCAG